MRSLRLALCALLMLNPLVLLAQGPIPTPAGALLQQPIIVIPSSGVNGGGVVIPAQLKLQDGTAAAPSLTFASQTTLGSYKATTNQMFMGTGNFFGTNFTSTSGIVYGQGSMNFGSAVSFGWSATTEQAALDTVLTRVGANKLGVGTTTIGAAQNKLTDVLDSTGAIGLEFNVGTPSLGTCTGGTLVSGGKNNLFEVTGNTSGSCVVNFGAPIWQNAPLCFVNDETALIAVRISARTTNAITVTGAGSGDAFQVYCLGRVGT